MMLIRSRHIYLLLTLTLAGVLLLSIFWEFYLEDLIVPHIYAGYHPEPMYERIEYIFVSVIFLVIALIVPGWLAIQSTRQNERTMEELRKAHAELEWRVQQRTAELENANRELSLTLERQHKTEEELRKSEKNLRHLSSSLLVLQENEKKLLSTELHDSVSQMLSALKFRLEQILSHGQAGNREMTADIHNKLLPNIQGAIDDVRNIYMDLRPTLLDDLGLIATLNWLSAGFQEKYPHIHVASDIGVDENAIPEYLKIVIFRVLQEGLDNIARHSQGNEARFSLTRHDRTLNFILQDNGIGFDIDKIQSMDDPCRGTGLTSMKARVEQTMGSFEIKTDKEAGVMLHASWPVGNGKTA